MEQLCKQCKRSFKIKKSKILPSGNSCSVKCRGKWFSKHPDKINSPFKKGHTGFRVKYGPLSEDIREKISKKLTGRTNKRTGLVKECVICKKKIYAKPSISVRKKYCSNSCRHEGKRHKDTKLIRLIRNCKEYKDWRTKLFTRDDYTCASCNKRGGMLHPHHLRPLHLLVDENHLTTMRQAQLCGALWDTNNGKTLCIKCHKETPSYLNRWWKP